MNACNGNPSINAEVKVTIKCGMRFRLYPFDVQVCPVILVVPMHQNQAIK